MTLYGTLDERGSAGCINCTGKEPPLTYYSEPEAYHDPRGRVYYIRWQQPIR
jgi:hypothetical protein